MSPEAFEGAILQAFGWTASDAPVEGLAAAYRALSEQIHATEALGGPTGLLKGGDEALRAAAWGLIFGYRTFRIANALLDAHPLAPGVKIAELGSGWGPFGLAAAVRGHPVELVDLAPERLRWSRGIYDAAGAARPQLRCMDLRNLDAGGFGALALPFSFGELERASGVPGAVDGLLSDWITAMGPGGRLFLIEPGTHLSGTRLQALRDRLGSRLKVHAPCPAIERCPMSATPKDWCHFTWNTPTGGITRRVAELAQRHSHQQHFSYLVLGPFEERSPHTPARLLDRRSLGKGKVGAQICTPTGLLNLTGLTRRPEVSAWFEARQPAEVLDLPTEALVRRGDGWRLEHPDRALRLRIL